MPTVKSLLFKTLVILLAISAVLAVSTAVLAADPYPSKPIRLIAPIAPGGGVDIIGRLIASKLSERLGRQVIVENHGGGGGILGVEMAAKADPDGHTLLIINATQSIQPALQKLPYEPVKSFTPIAKLGSGLLVLVVHPSVPANSVKEFIALAKQKPNQLICSSSSSGSVMHMSSELFKIMADIDFKIVLFKGSGPAAIDLLGGHSHTSLTTIATILPHIKSGKLKALGTSGAMRSVILPDVPTIAEAAIPGYEAVNWYGLLAPAGTPAPIVERLNREIKTILALDDAKKLFLNDGVEVDYLGPAEFGAFFNRDIAQWANVINKAKIKKE
jgi:tripartite-type tricarboxylate transporter receptor subunit TctC